MILFMLVLTDTTDLEEKSRVNADKGSLGCDFQVGEMIIEYFLFSHGLR